MINTLFWIWGIVSQWLVNFGGEVWTKPIVIDIKQAMVTPTQIIIKLPTPTPNLEPSPTEGTKAQQKSLIIEEDPNLPKEWGVAKQIGEHTWTMRVGQDEVMATPKEIFEALNDYRRRNGAAVLMWDEKLAAYAQSRADFFWANKKLDSHKGFGEYLEKEDGFKKLGFNAVGENSSYGYKMTGTHLIEWIFAGDEPHNKNQLNKDWAYAGIGVNQEAVDIIFGTGKF